jgi:O-antigen/teichoic acid export membrane protein
LGIIRKQSVQGTIIAYSGAVLGFINVGLFFPIVLSSDQVGLVNLIIAISTILAQFSTLGFVSVITRMFSYFRDPSSRHHGFLSMALLVSFSGFAVFATGFFLYKPIFLANNPENVDLLTKHFNTIFPLTLFTVLFLVFDNYSKVLYHSTIGIFLKELLFRIVTLLNLTLLFFGVYEFELFFNIYILSLCLPAIVLFFYLIAIGEFSLKTEWSFLRGELRRQVFWVAVFGILAGIGTIAISNIDKYLVNSILDLGKTGVYSIAFFFGTLISIPSRPLIKIASALIADAWKMENISVIGTIYKKSSLNQFIIGVLVYVGIVINLHNIFRILPPEYEVGKWVILIVSFANLMEMGSGVSGMVIQTSKYYRLMTYLGFLSAIVLIIAGYILIPPYGITGAAFAILITRGGFVIAKTSFIRLKFNIRILNYKYIAISLLGIGLFLLNHFITELESLPIDIIVRSSIVCIIYLLAIYFLRLSDDINDMMDKLLNLVRRK